MLEFAKTSPFPSALPQGSGLVVSTPAGLGLATLQPLRGQSALVLGQIEARLGLTLVDGPHSVARNGLGAIGTGPGRWLLMAEGAGNRFARRLKDIVRDAAAVNDQTDGYAVLRLAGPGCRPVLARGVNIDLHPDAFGAGAVAVTAIAHMGVILWRADDGENGSVFELVVFRSLAGNLLHWLESSIAGAGLALR